MDHESMERNDRENIWKQLQMGGHRLLHSLHFRKDGTSYPVEIHVTAVTLNDLPVILATVQNITQPMQHGRDG